MIDLVIELVDYSKFLNVTVCYVIIPQLKAKEKSIENIQFII